MPPQGARDHPEVAGLRLTTPRIEHRHRRLIDRQFGGGEEIGLEPFVQRHQFRRCIPDPERQRRAVEIEALGGQHFGLAVQRKMPAIFGYQHRGDHGFGRQSGFDQMLRRRRLHDPLAGPAGKPGPVPTVIRCARGESRTIIAAAAYRPGNNVSIYKCLS